MFCIPIIGPTFEAVKSQLTRALTVADMIELRIDLLESEARERLVELRPLINKPLICKGGGEELDPDYLDLETGGDIVSYHNFEETPADLDAILRNMPQGKIYKIATYAQSALDALNMILFTRRHRNVMGMCMGEKGLITRVLGSPWRYVALSEEEKSAPGQPTLDEMRRYQVGGELYGLIGKTVHQSPSHITHNQTMKRLGLKATYVKMIVEQAELESFLKLAKEVGFKGLSVTINLKEAIIPYLDRVETTCGSVNTLVLEEGKWVGFNTDGPGALAALPLKPCHVALLGTGGASKMIQHTFKEEGISFTVLGRGTLQDLPKVDYDVLVNTIPVDVPLMLQPNRVVMDIRHGETQLLKAAQTLGCQTIEGKEMFFHQASLQFSRWFSVEPQMAYELLSCGDETVPSLSIR